MISKKKDLYSKNVMKSGVSPQKLRNYWWQTPIRASNCTPVAPSLLISSGHSPRLGGHNFCLGGGGAQAVIWGVRPRYAPLWRRACLNVIGLSYSRLSNCFFFYLFRQLKLVWGVFPEAFCLCGQTI